jgi:hypothetical protein
MRQSPKHAEVGLVSFLTCDILNSRDEHHVSCSYNDSVDDNTRQPLGNSELFSFSFLASSAALGRTPLTRE